MAMVKKMTDKQLILSIKEQNRQALEVFYDRYERLVYHFALRFVQTPQLAEEVVQDVFLKIWKNASTYDENMGKVTTWMLSICRNAAIDLLKKAKYSRMMDSLEKVEAFHDQANDVHGEVEVRLIRESIRFALNRLPKEQRDVIRLMYYEGYSQSEISRHLSIPIGTVKGRARLAMAKLREELSGAG